MHQKIPGASLDDRLSRPRRPSGPTRGRVTDRSRGADTTTMPGWGSVRARLVLLISAAALLSAGAAPARADFGGGRAYLTTPIPAGAAVDRNSRYWLGQIAAQFPKPYLNGPGNLFSPAVYEANSSTPLRLVRCA